jgi:hypothetical protein
VLGAGSVIVLGQEVRLCYYSCDRKDECVLCLFLGSTSNNSVTGRAVVLISSAGSATVLFLPVPWK